MTGEPQELNQHENTEEMFLHVLSLSSPTEREAYLAEVRKQLPDQADQLEKLLNDYGAFEKAVESQSALARDASLDEDEDPTLDRDLSFPPNRFDEPAPERVGHYTVLEQIGHGGMGTVYLARQDAPRRKVALKIIPKRQVSGQFLARFEAEYQALAMMSHHHIARIFDAGATEDGNAYFAMEYIKGEPLNKFLQQHQLNIRERLNLFLQVCRGVQHAHQKAVVHRDLKPSNILVEMTDGKPTAKIIDFGLAKGLDNPLSGATLHTQAGTLAGTPAYMSPEQLVGRAEAVDTRGDIYSLGVILYEILAGGHPLDLKALQKKPLDEALRALRLEEPPPPSARARAIDPLAQPIPEDLDHIALKAMSKAIKDRYSSVDALREDIHNYLEHRPVIARGRSGLHVFAKFVRRNRVFFMAAAMGLFALLVGLALSVTSSIKANRAREEAQTALAFLQDVLAAPNPRGGERDIKVVEVLRQAEERLSRGELPTASLEASARNTLGNTFFGLGMYDDAESQFMRSWNLLKQVQGPHHHDTLRSRYYLARVLRRRGALEMAEQHFEEILKTQTKTLGERHQHTLQTMAGMAMSLRLMKRYDESEQLFRKVLVLQRGTLGDTHRDTLISLVGLANSCYFQNKLEEASNYYREALTMQTHTLGPDSPETMATRHALANAMLKQKEYGLAEDLFRDNVERRERVLGPLHSETTISLYGLGRCYYLQKRLPEAAEVFAEVVYRRREVLGADASDTLRAVNLLAKVWRRTDELEDAVGLLEGVVETDETSQEAQYMKAVQNLADFYYIAGQFEDAIVLLERKLTYDLRTGDGSPWSIRRALAFCHAQLGNTGEAGDQLCEAIDLVHDDQRKADELREMMDDLASSNML